MLLWLVILLALLIKYSSGFKFRLGQTKYYKIGICSFSAKLITQYNWLAQNQDNVSK
jgi:hypothetical protein